MSKAIEQAVKAVQAAGFDVYMRNPTDSYFLYTDGTRIGYLQEEPGSGGFSISTVHKLNATTGTGFRVDGLGGELIARKILELGFATAPAWASRDLATVKKWKDIEAFRAANSFNAGYQKQEPA